MSIFAIDPGTEESAYVVLNKAREVCFYGMEQNDQLLETIGNHLALGCGDRIAIEMVACYGLPVGRETFETCVWIGRFIQAACPVHVELITRNEIKMRLCHTIKGVNDSVLRQRLIDIYGPGKEQAIGNKAKPGPLYGIKSHLWSALAVAVASLPTQEPFKHVSHATTENL